MSRHTVLVATLVLLGAACGDAPSGPSLAQLAGRYEFTQTWPGFPGPITTDNPFWPESGTVVIEPDGRVTRTVTYAEDTWGGHPAGIAVDTGRVTDRGPRQLRLRLVPLGAPNPTATNVTAYWDDESIALELAHPGAVTLVAERYVRAPAR